MICTANRFVERSISNFFCVDSVLVGDPVFEHDVNIHDRFSSCSSIHNKKGDFIGISLYHVVDIDLMTTRVPYNCACVNSKIDILTKGWLVYKLNPKWKIPIKQRLYCCPKSGKITWRRSPILIGIAESAQDKEGFIKVRIDK